VDLLGTVSFFSANLYDESVSIVHRGPRISTATGKTADRLLYLADFLCVQRTQLCFRFVGLSLTATRYDTAWLLAPCGVTKTGEHMGWGAVASTEIFMIKDGKSELRAFNLWKREQSPTEQRILSIWPCVKLVDCVETATCIIRLLSSSDSLVRTTPVYSKWSVSSYRASRGLSATA